MVGDSEGDALELVPGFAELGDGFFNGEEGFGGTASEGDDDEGFDDLGFGFEEGEGGGDFVDGGAAVVGGLVLHRGAIFTDVGEVDFVAGEAHRFENLGEFLAGRADEGGFLAFLVVAGGFADEHDVGIGVSGGEDEVVAEGAEGFEVGIVGELVLEGGELGGGVGALNERGGGSGFGR